MTSLRDVYGHLRCGPDSLIIVQLLLCIASKFIFSNIALAYAGFHNGVLNDESRLKISSKQADFTVFAPDPRGARAPFAPPGYAGA